MLNWIVWKRTAYLYKSYLTLKILQRLISIKLKQTKLRVSEKLILVRNLNTNLILVQLILNFTK